MQKLANEELLSGEEDRGLVLTTHRLRWHGSRSGNITCKSICLDQVCYCGVAFSSNPILLWLAGLVLLGGFVMTSQGSGGPLLFACVLALLLVIVYFATRVTTLVVQAAQGGISVRFQGKAADAMETLEAIEEARFRLLGKA